MNRNALGVIALITVLVIGATAWAWWTRQLPIVSGEVAFGTIWDDPPCSPSRGGNPIEAGSRVGVFDGFIVVTTPGGERIISPHGWYSGLTLKP